MAQTNFNNAEPKPFPESFMREDWRRYYKTDDPGLNTGHGARESNNGRGSAGDRGAPDTGCPPPERTQAPKSGILDSLLGSMRLSGRADGDRILLLGLLLLLSGEDCDRLLLLAILYILI